MNHPFLARSCHWTLFSHTIFLFPVYVVFVWVILNSSRGKNSFHVLVHSSTGRIRDERDQRLPVDHATTLQNWSLVMSTQCRSISVMSCKHRLHRVISQDQELHALSRRLRDLTRRCESAGSHLIQVRVCDRFTLHHFTTNLYNSITGISEHGGEYRGRVTGRLRTRGREGLVNYRIVFFSPGVYCLPKDDEEVPTILSYILLCTLRPWIQLQDLFFHTEVKGTRCYTIRWNDIARCHEVRRWQHDSRSMRGMDMVQRTTPHL